MFWVKKTFTHVIDVFGCLVEVPVPIYIGSGVQGLGRTIPVIYNAEPIRCLGQVVVHNYIIFWLSRGKKTSKVRGFQNDKRLTCISKNIYL